jgi:hypothetical protein
MTMDLIQKGLYLMKYYANVSAYGLTQNLFVSVSNAQAPNLDEQGNRKYQLPLQSLPLSYHLRLL